MEKLKTVFYVFGKLKKYTNVGSSSDELVLGEIDKVFSIMSQNDIDSILNKAKAEQFERASMNQHKRLNSTSDDDSNLSAK